MTLPALVVAVAQQREEELDFYTVSPGLPGFITFFVFALAGWLLFRSMTGHMRKVRWRAAQERAAQEHAGEGTARPEASVRRSTTDPASTDPPSADRPEHP